MQVNYPDQTQNLSLYVTKENEKCLIFSVYGDGGRCEEELTRHKKVMDSQEEVFGKFNIPLNRFYHNFNYYGMGPKITQIVNTFIDKIDYFIILDIDICPLKASFIDEIIDKIKDGRTVFGGAQQSNHVVVNGNKHHLYASLSYFGISSKIYNALGKPSFESNHRGDVAEEIAWLIEEKGYNMCLTFPSSFMETTVEEQKQYGVPSHWDLGNGHRFGLATVYGDAVFHATMQALPRSTDLFVQKCNEMISSKN